MSQPPSHMQDLSQQISAATSILTDFLFSNGLPEPSFRADAPLDAPSMPEDVQVARRTLREAAQELYILATYPSEYLRWLACNVCSPSSPHPKIPSALLGSDQRLA